MCGNAGSTPPAYGVIDTDYFPAQDRHCDDVYVRSNWAPGTTRHDIAYQDEGGMMREIEGSCRLDI